LCGLGLAQAADEFTRLNSKFQAASQEFGILTNLFMTSMKTLGESLSAMARKN
jgi:hypothetical protein